MFQGETKILPVDLWPYEPLVTYVYSPSYVPVREETVCGNDGQSKHPVER